MEFSGFNSKVHPNRILQIRSDAEEYLSEPLEGAAIEEWTGFRPMCYDDLPIIGRSAFINNLVIATGHGSTGLSMAPGTGKLVAEIIAEKKPFMDASPFRVDRF